eukprot:scaffold36659_cov22-Tisochrysis_lutea.AAC.1
MSCGTVWAEWGWLEGGASSFCRPLLPREDVSMRPNKAAPALGSRARACMRAWQCCPDRLLAWHVCNQQKEGSNLSSSTALLHLTPEPLVPPGPRKASHDIQLSLAGLKISNLKTHLTFRSSASTSCWASINNLLAGPIIIA